VPPVIRLYDTLAREVLPVPDGPVGIYVCGVTPYDTTHLGHAFTFVQFDTLVRCLRWLGRDVTYVQNVTDIDDSILIRARELGEGWRELGDRETARYVGDMRGLNVLPPDHLVRATECLDTMRTMIRRLLDLGAAYRVDDGTVYFRVAATPTYGELSHLPRERMLAIAAAQDDSDVDDPRKEDPLDFALWGGWSGRDDEPAWEADWGRGRPGWHIECSAIALRYLGPRLTIHGGGSDLVFPHHESEIAQTERYTGIRPFARLWMHVAMTWMSGEKMSKSVGNMVFVRDLFDRYEPDAVRLYLLSRHYRTAFEYDDAELRAAAVTAERLRAAASAPDDDEGARAAFHEALIDDFDTPSALRALERAAGAPLRELAGVLGLKLGRRG
jgi:L-cysteine:1D-myo-inositol 2-amino-2-deoxy-alpha-D-glucopyranoside ligase